MINAEYTSGVFFANTGLNITCRVYFLSVDFWAAHRKTVLATHGFSLSDIELFERELRHARGDAIARQVSDA